MRLFLASRVVNTSTLNKLTKYIGGFKGKSIAYIPTASNGEEAFGSWKVKTGGSWEIVRTLGANVKDIQLEDYKNRQVVEELKGKDIIWFAGGSSGYLMYWIRRCGIDKALLELLKTSLYVGSSAGSMIASKTLEVAGWEEPGAEVIPGLGLVDFDLIPHYEDHMLDEFKKKYRGNKLYLLKDGEEILMENDKVTVQGEERIISHE